MDADELWADDIQLLKISVELWVSDFRDQVEHLGLHELVLVFTHYLIMSKNLIHSLFLKNSKGAESKKPEPKAKPLREEVDNQALQTKDYYRIMNEKSDSSLAQNVLNKCFRDKVVIKEKLKNKIFLLGNRFKEGEEKVCKRDVSKFKELCKNMNLKYSDMKKLNQEWEDYMFEFFDQAQSSEGICGKFLMADLHGAEIKVVHSLNSTLIGLEGIVIKDDFKSFQIVTKKNELKLIIKKICRFSI